MYFYLIILLILLYASLYYLYNNEFSIYQVNIENFDFELLYKKQPIVISEKITNIDNVIDNWFNYNIIYNLDNNYIWEKNKYKYLFVISKDNEPVEISLCNPNSQMTQMPHIVNDIQGIHNVPHQDSNITTIKLDNKGLIIPFHWYYYISGNANIYGIHDYITICTAVLSKKI
jgi:hypothetical protein